MRIKKTLGVAALSFGVATACVADEKTANLNKINEIDRQILEATDARDALNPVFDEALKAGNWHALVYLGQIGGDACERIKPYLSHEAWNVRMHAAVGAQYCYDESLGAELVAQYKASQNTDLSRQLAYALGFSGGEKGRDALVARLAEIEVPVECGILDTTMGELYGLLQSIVYDRLEPSALPSLDTEGLLKLTAHGCNGYQAAYLLGRIQGLSDVLALDAVEAAIDAAPSSDVKRALVRVSRQYGDVASGALMRLAAGDDHAVAMEAVRALGFMKDANSLAFLMDVAASSDIAMRHLALSALATRSAGDAAITGLLDDATKDANGWIAVTALRGLMQRDPDKAFPITENWFGGEDYYKAFSAMGMLAQSDEGKDILKAYAEAHPDTIRGREAAIALDPSIEGIEKARKTPSWTSVVSYQGRELKLKTNRGTVCIAPSTLAPYAAANFMLLADVGKMNGMLWHRVIPNFVAQAGQSEDPELAQWGTIREEWGGHHTPGTVGVATAGRDTGGTQFFINTAYNLHLDGRYTVMGNVISGMDAAMALQEGDVISRAETVMAGKCQ